jgi:mRNA (2'-O-methyladenosine-N6-)-methyltransferase
LDGFSVHAGKYLEIFGRKNNLHNFWVTIGNEVTGTGLPVEDEAAVKGGLRIPGAVYGAGR